MEAGMEQQSWSEKVNLPTRDEGMKNGASVRAEETAVPAGTRTAKSYLYPVAAVVGLIILIAMAAI